MVFNTIRLYQNKVHGPQAKRYQGTAFHENICYGFS